jgi:hypothetical protein
MNFASWQNIVIAAEGLLTFPTATELEGDNEE